MAMLYDYYRPHSATLVANENYGEDAREPIVEGSGRMLPVQPCIVLDARGLNGKPATQIALREGLLGTRADEYIPAVDVSKYGSDVLRSMWAEIVDLRGQLRQLQASNRQLHQEIQSKQRRYNDNDYDNGRTRKHDDPLDFGEKYEMLKKKLSKQASDILDYRERIDQLQRELIKKNAGSQKVGYRSNPESRSNTDLQLKLRDKDSKVRELQMACKEQEKIIEQLEKLLEKKNDDLYEQREQDMLAKENRRLKNRLQRMANEDEDKAGLREELKERNKEEIMEGRIKTLEKQISDNAKRWAQERTDLVLRLQEAEFGLRSHPRNGNFESLPSNFASSSRRNFENPSKSKSTTYKNRGLPNLYR